MKFLTLAAIIFLTVNTYSQEIKTIYFDSKSNEVLENTGYEYKRVISNSSATIIEIKEYYSNGELKLNCTSIIKKKYDLASFDVVNLKKSNKIKLDGEFIEYYPTGEKKHESFYKKGKIQKSLNYTESGEIVYFIVDRMPVFIGGDDKLREYLSSEVQYPNEALDSGVQGMVFISFVVNKQGNVENAVVARGIHPLLNKEALRVIESMPAWIPGTLNGTPENVAYTIPINFK